MDLPIILASGSAHRRGLLANAGIAVDVMPSTIDERAVEDALDASDVTPDDVAAILAEAKAVEVSERSPGRIVLGADQTLALGDEILHKVSSMEEARRTLLKLSGKSHRLHSAYALVRDGSVLQRRVETATITFRDLSPAAIGHYLARVGDTALSSVGCYQVEGQGLTLIDRIDGDVFTIMGLPMLPLLNDLRQLGALND